MNSPAEWGDWLYININVVGEGFSTQLQFKKPLVDPYINSKPHSAITYSRGSAGTHSNDGGSGAFIMSSLGELFDEFLTDYLRVNEGDCQ